MVLGISEQVFAGAKVALRDGMRERRRREWCGRARAEQCLPKGDATPQRDACAPTILGCGRSIPSAARSPLREAPRATLRGAMALRSLAS